MNWLHCAWGCGATLGPMIMAGRLATGAGWRPGYVVVAGLQFGLAPFGLVLLGLGFAPIYPAVMHETPRRFVRELARSAIGLQVSAAYIGAPIVPGLMGLAASHYGLGVVPVLLVTGITAVLLTTEALNALTPPGPRVRQSSTRL